MSSLSLEYDSSRVNGLNTQKVMVAVPLIYMFMVYVVLGSLTTSSRSFDGLRAPRRWETD